MVLAWENLWRFLWCWSSFCCCCYSSFCCCCCSSFVDVFHSHFLFNIIPQPSVDYRQVFRLILYFQPSPSHSDSRRFHFSTIPLSSYCESYGFEWAFFTHRHFLPYAPSQHFWHNLLLSRFHWQPAVTFLKVAGLHTDWSSKHRPGPSVCLIHSNPQSSIHLNFVFMHVNIAKVLLVVKTLIRSAATLFSSHENIKQQPN